ncbi:MAG: hypothetical protein HY521_10180 [Proteobacteria bacterium]|nr:hypothetical protein [Pseudomonadota bacterium]
MILWFAEPPRDWPRPENGEAAPRLGAFRPAGAEPSAGEGPALVEVSEAAPPAMGAGAAAWLLGAGLGGHAPLIEAAAATGLPVLVAVNGLGGAGLAGVRRRVAGGALVLAFDARGQEDDAFLEQLAWLDSQTEPFAVIADSPARFAEAALFGPHGLIVPKGGRIEADPVLRIFRARAAGAPRPMSPAEVDALQGREASLTVARARAAGERLEPGDLAVAVTESKGLSPALGERVVGQRLRYPIRPGEALTFGHLAGPAVAEGEAR